ncbi:hypothetical protein AtEden1_Chr3g0180561 [Arabidopsis thaliana]
MMMMVMERWSSRSTRSLATSTNGRRCPSPGDGHTILIFRLQHIKHVVGCIIDKSHKTRRRTNRLSFWSTYIMTYPRNVLHSSTFSVTDAKVANKYFTFFQKVFLKSHLI